MVDYRFTEDRTMVEARCNRLVTYVISRLEGIRLDPHERDRLWQNCFFEDFKKLYSPERAPRSISSELIALGKSQPLIGMINGYIESVKDYRRSKEESIQGARETLAGLVLVK